MAAPKTPRKPPTKKKGEMLKDWRFILLMAGIVFGLTALVLLNPSVSPIDKYMKNKGGGFSQITGLITGESTGFSNAPQGSYELVGAQAGTQFAWVDARYLESRSTLRAIGAAACAEAKSQDYCEVYFWTSRPDIVIQLPVVRSESLAVFYESKNGKVSLKLLQQH